MSNLVDSPLVQVPHDKFWDAPPTRREVQRALKKMGQNDSELMGMADTAALVLNYILEVKFGMKDREELDVYVAAKALQMKEAREKMKAAAEAEDKAPVVAP